MDPKQKTKQLLKILIGVAWIDGIIQTEERDYLHKVAQDKGLAEEPDIKPLLSELKPIQATQCYQWVEEYLGDNASEEDYQDLLESLSALIYSDGEVQTQEAQLLSKLQLMDPAQGPSKSRFDKLLRPIQRLYRQAVSQQS
jgi:uncharacterized tellurite resistance protein B-like protein